MLVGPSGTFSGSNQGATREPGEPNHWTLSGGYSVWHSWTAPYDGLVNFDTVGSYFDTVLAVYTGTNVAALTLIGNNDDFPGIGLMSRVSFNAVAGTEYKIAVDGYSTSAQGLYILNWYYENQQTNPPTPPLQPNQVQFAQNSYTVQENIPGFVKIYIMSGGGNASPISVNYETTNGTAIAGVDYIAKSGQIVFNPGETNNSITIQIIDNAVVNSNKTFGVRLFNPAGGAALGQWSNTVVTIVDDETVPYVSSAGELQFSASLYSVTEREYTYWNGDGFRSIPGALVTVNRLNGSTGRIMVDYVVTNAPILPPSTNFPPNPNQIRPAVPDFDYLPATGTLIFDDGQTSTNFLVRTFADGISNGTAEVLLYLTNPRPAPEEDPALIVPRLGIQSNSAVQIVEVTTQPMFSFERLNYRVDEYGNRNITIAILLPGGGGGGAWVEVVMGNPYYYGQLSAGSDYARPNVDYTDMSQIVSFGPTETRKTITIPILDDTLVEFNEDIPIILYRSNGRPINPRARYTRVTILYDEQPPGAADREWNPDRVPYTTPPFNLMPGANNQVYSVAVQPDNKTVIGGDFTAVNTIPRNRVARFNADGSLDTNFLAHPNTGANGFVSKVIVLQTSQDAGKILIAGGFSSFNGYLRNCIARLNSDGSLDQSFNPGSGANGPIWAMAVQSDGRILIGGEFTTFNEKRRVHIARLNPDGSLDETFNPLAETDGTVWSIAIADSLPGTPVYIGGDFTRVNGEPRNSIARLSLDGTLDYTFNPGTGADGPVYAMAVQLNGAVVIGGSFSEIDSKPRNNIARLNPDGSLDLTFNPGTGANDAIYSIVLRPSDEHIYIGGLFTFYNQTRRMGLALVKPDGTLDTTFMDTAYNQFAGLIKTFSFEPNHFVRSIAIQPDGNLMIGGSFTNIGGNFARYINNNSTYSPVWTRQDKIVRMNVARVIGTWGTTVNSEGVATPNPPQGPGNVDFITSNYFIDENQPIMNVTLRRVDGLLGTVGVSVNTSNRLAVAGVDYGMVSASPVFSEWWGFMRSDGYPGPVYLQIPIFDDDYVEGDETLDIGMSAPFGQINLGGEYIPLGGALGKTYVTLTIVDNDFEHGILAFSSSMFTTNENATNLIVTVIRTNGATGTVTVDYYTKNGSAIAGSGQNPGDFTSVRGTLTFPPGVTNRTIVIPLYDDTEVELDETFYVVLTNATGGAKLPGGIPTSSETATCVIIDNDFHSGRLNFSATNYFVSEGDGQVVVTVSRIGGNLGPLSVSVVTSNGTAIAGSDYIYTSNRLSWVHNETTPKTVVIPILDDSLVEGNETFTVNLVSPSVSGSIGSMGSATIVVGDDDSYGAFQFSQPKYSVDENGTNLVITVLRIGGSAGAVSVDYSTADGSAIAGVHYVPTSGTLNFAVGEVSKTFSVQPIDNSNQDGERLFNITLSNPRGGAALGTISNAQVVIIDDESVAVPAGSIDTTFITGTGPDRPDKPVHSILIQPDGYLIIGGEFGFYNNVIRKGIARIDSIGRLDPSFDIGDGFNDQLRAMALQPDGKIVIGGFFTQVNGVNRSRIARLNKDGSLDMFFNPGSGADSPIYAVAIQSDGRILVGGSFNTFNGIAKPGIVRLNTNGTLHAGFDVGSGVEGKVYAIALQSDGKILIGGEFTRVNYQTYNGIARLNPNGSIDTTFNPGLGASGAVRSIVVQPDGKILIGGSFTNFNGQSRNYIVRLNKDGSIDNSFMAGEVGANEAVYGIALQADGKILVAGSFTMFNGVTRNRITRLNPDGSTDPSINFGEGANGFISALLVQPDNKIVIGGGFTMVDGKPRNHLARLHGGSLAGSGTLQFSNPYFTVDENEPVVSLTVLRRGGTYGSVSVLYATADGTAISGADYLAATNRIQFPPGEVMQFIRIPIIDDSLVEPMENFYVYLDDATGGADIGIVPVAIVNIASDDSIITFSGSEYSVSENTPSGLAKITVFRQGSTNGTVTVDCMAVSNIFGPNPAMPYFDFTPKVETLVFGPGVTSLTFTVSITNDFLIEPPETILLQLANWQPTNSVSPGITNSILTIIDDDFSPGVIEFSSANYSVGENRTNVVITLIRTNGSSGLVSVRIDTANGTATAGLDYIGGATTVAFADGETVKTFTIPIINDTEVEPDEIFYVSISNPIGGATLGGLTNAVVKIYDDDFAARYVRFAETNFVVYEDRTNAIITVFRGGLPDSEISVDFAVYDGTAVAGADYIPVSGTLTWAVGDEQPKTFLVPIIDDKIGENDETVVLILTNATAGTAIATPVAQLTIVSDDTTFKFSTNNFYVMENATNAVITVQRVGVFTNGAVSVSYRTVGNGTAVAGLDYLPVSGTLFWMNGDGMPKTFTVPIIDNTGFNADKTFGVELYNPVGPTNIASIYLEDPSNAVVTIVNDDAQNPPAGGVDYTFNFNYGANGTVRAIGYDQKRQLYIGGEFTMVNGIAQNRITRLTTNATVDTSFNIGSGFNNSVYALYVNTNGQVIVGGNFTRYNGAIATRLIILDTNGAPVPTFNSTNGPNSTVRAVALDVLSNFTFYAASFMGEMNSHTNVIQVGANSGTINMTYQFPVPFVSPTNTNALPIYTNTLEIVYDNIFLFRTNIIVQSNAVTGNVVLNFGPGINNFFTIYVNRNWTNGSQWNYSGTVTVGGAADRKIYIGGDFIVVGSSVLNRIARILPDGNVDLSFNPGSGANNSVYAVAVQNDGKVIIGGAFTSYDGVLMNRIARLNQDGTLDPTFDPGSGANGTIRTVVIQPDGRILIGGDFTTIGGVPRGHIARLNSNGSVDLTFDPENGANDSVRSIAIQTDGKIVIGGDFTSFNGNLYNGIVRLNSDGSVDTSFYTGAGANAPVYSVALADVEAPLVVSRQSRGLTYYDRLIVDTGSQYGVLRIDYDFSLGNNNLRVYYDNLLLADLTTNGVGSIILNYGPGMSTFVTIVINETQFFGGTPWSYTLTVSGGTRRENLIAIGGNFTRFNQKPRGRVAVLNDTGNLSSVFDPSGVPNFAVYSMAIYTNAQESSLVGKMVVGGNFSSIVGSQATNLARLDLHGFIDTNFSIGTGPDKDVRSVLIQPDGNIVIGGSFTNVNGIARAYMARILTNGLVDPYFNQGVGADGPVNSMALQSDGKIVIGGAFTRVYGAIRNGIARVNPDGSVDTTFATGAGANDVVNAVALQNDGKVVIGGAFTTVRNQSMKAIARLNPDGTLDASFIPVSIEGTVRTIAIDASGRIIIGGAFVVTAQNYQSYGIARLNSNGSLDATFNPGTGANDYISGIGIDSSGKIVVVGAFTEFNGQMHNRIVRLNPDGSIDPLISFGQGANNFISSVLIDDYNRKILIGGGFSEFNGEVRYGIARIFAGDNSGAGEFQFSAASYSVSESAGEVELMVVRNLGASGTVSVDYSTIDGTAVGGVDYVRSSGRITFAPGEVIKRIKVGVIDNNVVNPQRSFRISLFNPIGGATLGTNIDAMVNILENDSIISYASREFTVVEGTNYARISVVRQGGTEDTVSVECLTGTNGTATPYIDYIPVSVTLVFNPGIQSQSFNIPIIDDSEYEMAETVSLEMQNLVGPAALGASNAVLKIVDNDISPGVIGFATNYYTVIENNPVAVITLIRTNGYSGVVSVNYAVGIGGTATAGQDYIATNGVVTFAENETTKTFTVRILDDNVIEGNETILMRLSGPSGGAVLGTDTAVLVINDDDRVGSFVFSKAEYIVSEGVGSAIVQVQRIGGSIGQASVTVMTSGGTATPGVDYIGVSNVLYFADGETNKTIAIPIVDDSIVETPETIGLILINPTDGATLGAQPVANVVVVDNEVSISLASQSYSVSETGVVAVISVVRYGDTNISVSARYNTSDGTAVAGQDYLATNGVVQFAPGQTNNYIFVSIIDDTVPESDEIFNVTLSNPSTGAMLGPINSAPVVIIENDDVLYFSAPTYSVVESFTNVIISVLRAGNTNESVTIDYRVGGGTATPVLDFIAIDGTLTFAPGQTSNTFSIFIWDDMLVEGPETVNLALVNPTGGAVVGTQGTAVLVIQDNDSSVGFAKTNYVAAEKATNAVITLIRSGVATGEVSVVLSTSNLTAIAGQDYLYTSNVVKWAAGDLAPKTVLIPLLDDAIPEGTEEVALILSNPSGGVVIETNFAILKIVDNAGFIAFGSQYYRVNEDQGYAVINLIRSGGSNGVVSVDYSVVGGSATPNVDFTNAAGRIVFADGEVIKSILIPVVNDGIIEGPETAIFALSNPLDGALVGSPSTTTLTIYDSQVGVIDPAGMALLAESFTPPNNVIEPGETVTISFGLRNTGFINTTNLVATLLPGNGVSNIRTNTQTYGALQAGGSVVSRPFTFTAAGTNGSTVIARLQLSDGGVNLGIVSFTFILGRVPSQFCSANQIIINDNTNATPYPSVINVSGVPGVVSKVVVTLNGMSHNYPSDIDILLVSPDGKAAILMSDAGNGFAINNVNLTFDDAASTFVPENGQITSGTYRPTNYLAADIFPPSAPAGPYGSDLSVFNGINPNGYWALYVVDDDRMDSGSIAGGWCLSIITTEGVLPSSDLAVTLTDSPDPVYVGGELTYTISVTNYGPGAATGVILNNQLPAGTTIISVNNPYGQVTTNINVISATLGTMPAGANAQITIKVKVAAQPGSIISNRASITALESDQNLANNEAIVKTVVAGVPSLSAVRKGANILLIWPADAGIYAIESASSLTAGVVWTTVTNASQPIIVGGYYNVTVPIESGGNRFFRLRLGQ
jgi:uncharacterized delta-60 repeat protein/uncharacterized repeat protein (TIGR01451 family)